MTIFLLALLPLSVLIFYFQKDKENRAHLLVVIFIGFLTSTLFVGYKILFSSSYYIPAASFFKNFIAYALTQAFFPVVVVYGLFFFFTKKDSLEARCSHFFPLLASFYTVYLPYVVLETDKPYSPFYLFVKPLLFLSMLVFTHIWLNKACVTKLKTTTAKNFCNFAALVINIFFPAIIESMWICGAIMLFWGILTLAYFGVIGLLIFPKSTLTD
ncbi:MAG: hypothetical protein IJM22_05515 [Treponema sp.]|nr:hypothetical protein [Treponema sp.]